MKNIFQIFVLCSFLFLQVNAKAQTTSSNREKNEKKILELVLKTLSEEHVNPKKLDDTFSKKLFNHYLDFLDQYKIFFIQSDIDEFKKYETKLDDQLKANDLTFFNLTYDRLKIRMIEGKEIYTNILKNKLDFTSNQDSQFYKILDKKDLSTLYYSKNTQETIQKWNNILSTVVIENSVKDFFFYNKKKETFETIFTTNSNNIFEFLERSFFNYVNFERENLFTTNFINTILPQFDSNSEYFTNKGYTVFLNKRVNKKLTNGLVYEQGPDFVQVSKLISGSSAEMSKKIEIGDSFLKIQKEDQKPINVLGFNMYEVAKIATGKLGDVVKFTLKRQNGSIYEVSLKMATVFTKDIFVKSAIVKKDNLKFGVLSFSDFYFENPNDDEVKNSQIDFLKELEILRNENAEGLILDLRNNSGATVTAAIEILTNFLTNTKIAQLKTQTKLEVLETKSGTKNWDKSIVVIVNHKTASTAELLAKAFQEYNLGIVIGEVTHGKSSIENFKNLDPDGLLAKDGLDIGVLSFSSKNFYNLNGKSIQRKGVLPDVVFNFNDKLDREALYVRSLLADEIKPIAFTPVNKLGYFSSVIKASQDRLNKSENFKRVNAKLQEDINFENKLAEIKTLNYTKLSAQIDALLANEKVIEEPVFDKNREFSIPKASLNALKDQEYLISKRNNWLEELKTDIQIDEGINILQDMLYMKQ